MFDLVLIVALTAVVFIGCPKQSLRSNREAQNA